MRLFVGVCLLSAAVALAGCSSNKKEKLDPFAGVGSPYYSGSGPLPKGGGKYHVGKPYQVAGRWFTPKEQPSYDKSGIASWYGEAFHRRKTSNGEWFDMNELTAAHATLPLPSYAKVTNLENGRQVVVRINDRGPFVGTRIIDLSKRSADALGFRAKGKAEVRVQWIGLAPLGDKGNNLIAMNRALGQGASIAELREAALPGTGGASSQTAFAGAAPAAFAKKQTGYSIQVASFTDEANALAAVSMVSEVGNAQLVTNETADGPVYRAIVGPLRSEAEARQILEQVQAAGFHNARIKASGQQLAVLQ